MKALGSFLLALVLACNLAIAQDTLYIYEGGIVVTMRPVAHIDSITFYRNAFIPQTGKVTDVDGNEYGTVKIGTQVWMVENLKTTKYRNGDEIGTTTPATKDIEGESAPKYQWAYNGDEGNVAKYGRLYTGYTVADTRNITPKGWHVPTNAEWTTLENYLIANGFNYDGTTSGNKIAKSLAATSDWRSFTLTGYIGNDLTKNNASGFTAMPGGYRFCVGYFLNLGEFGYWRTFTESTISYSLTKYLNYNGFALNVDNLTMSDGYSVRCLKDDNTTISMPTLSATVAPTNITTTSAISGGNIISNGGAAITARGVCWNTTGTPTITDNKTSDSTDIGHFISRLNELTANTLYYARAYATNSAGTAYGEQVSFTTQSVPESMVADIDGNLYHTVTIGTQVWMVENLKTTKYRNGDTIGTTSPATKDISGESAPKYQWAYNGDEGYVAKYGRLYSWSAVSDSRILAPIGWHVSTDAEWATLENYLIANGYNYDGNIGLNEIAKSLASTTDWYANGELGAIGNDLTKNNRSGFTAMPSGYRLLNGVFDFARYYSLWWSSTEYNTSEALYRAMYFNFNYEVSYHRAKAFGMSVRCVKDTGFAIVIPTLSATVAASSISTTSAISGGNITSDGGAAITGIGVCWNTTGTPTIADSKTSDSTVIGGFTSTLTGLTANTLYYMRAYATNSAGTAYGEQVSFYTAPAIGTNYQGGIVAYILQPGDIGYLVSEIRGLIAAPSDQSTSSQWGCIYTSLCSETQANGSVYGKGNQNTLEIMAGCSTAGIAARLCGDLVLGGYSDWFLPSMGELNKLYLNRTAIGGFANAGYWSSSEGTAWYSYEYDFSNGNQNYPNKDYLFHVRAVRTFAVSSH